MPLFTRVKNILRSPKTEWDLILTETETPQSLLGKYVIPMALIPAIALFIGYGLIGFDAIVVRISGIRWGVIMAIDSFIGSILTYFICTFVIDALAPSFCFGKESGEIGGSAGGLFFYCLLGSRATYSALFRPGPFSASWVCTASIFSTWASR